MELHPKQKEVVESKTRFKVIRAGRRSGKTIVEVEDMFFTAVSKKDRQIFYVCPTQIQAREIVWEMFRRRIPKEIATFHEQRLEIKIQTTDKGTSYIKLAGWENRENFRGKRADKIVFDEVDTMRDFFLGWHEIFRPTLIDSGGDAIFIGTPKKENPNLRRLEKIAQEDDTYQSFHFTTEDNPFIPEEEKETTRQSYKDQSYETYRQEILAQYIEDRGALFKHSALVDVFSNTITKSDQKYMTVDIADDGTDKTIFSLWEDLEEYRREEFEQLNTEMIINKIREYAAEDRIPYSHIAVDAIGVGAGVASSSLLDGIIGFKSSYQPIKTDMNIVRLPNVSYTSEAKLTSDYKNLRSQCVFTLADYVNKHKIASRLDGKHKEIIIEELQHYQDASKGDGKRLATLKEDVKEMVGHSPDSSDTWIQRMYFVIMSNMLPEQSEDKVIEQQINQFKKNQANFEINNNR